MTAITFRTQRLTWPEGSTSRDGEKTFGERFVGGSGGNDATRLIVIVGPPRTGVLIEERDGAVKASLRAKAPLYRVDQIAKRFGGGGHACAAGLNIAEGSIKAFYPQLMEALSEDLEAIDKS